MMCSGNSSGSDASTRGLGFSFADVLADQVGAVNGQLHPAAGLVDTANPPERGHRRADDQRRERHITLASRRWSGPRTGHETASTGYADERT